MGTERLSMRCPNNRLIPAVMLVLLAAFAAPLTAQTSNQQRFTMQARRIDRTLRLTGRLSDPAWRTAEPAALRHDVDPGENTPPRVATTAYVLYNTEYLYVGFDCADSNPTAIRASITERDKIYQDDFVVFLLDTYGDSQRAYEFFVNPHGIQGDALQSGNLEDDSFDAIWESAAAVSDSGWTAEMAIPFKSLRFPSSQEQIWRIHFARIYPRDSRYTFAWTTYDRNNPCLMCQAGTLTGIRDVEATRSVELLPYAAAMQRSGLRDIDDAASPFDREALHARVGGGIRYAPSPNLSFDAVVNPDFSQVESDAAQISVNTTFALFYPEKRPFFVSGADQFNSRITMYHSRMINNPLAAAKVTGKYGKLSFGYVTSLDRHTPFIIPGEEESSFESSSYRSFSNILRARYDLGEESFLGAMITARNIDGAHNYAGSIDGNYRFLDNYFLRGQAIVSHTKELNDPGLFSDPRRFGSTRYTAAFDGEQYTGSAVDLRVGRSAREYSFDVGVRDHAPTFQAQNGFVTRTNQRQIHMNHEYTFYPESSFVDRAFLDSEAGMEFNYDGVRKERWWFIGGGLRTKGPASVFVGVLPFNQERYGGAWFPHIERLFVNAWTNPAKSLEAGFSGEFGKFINRDDPPELGAGHQLGVTLRLRPTSQLSVNLSYDRARLKSVSGGNLLYDGYIARMVTAYQFTAALLIRLIGQYDSFDRAIDVYPLVNYRLSAFTVFYIGSTYNLMDYDDQRRYNFRQTERQYFMKVQYLLQY